ncbi:hypothetical protein ABEH28_01470 [Pseudomonas sp. Ps21-P2]|uniref:hypothetical protein n=1 Tax=Pseudomonas sp. Ps21-P2 TaxID=3080331 RepID=UPI003207932A
MRSALNVDLNGAFVCCLTVYFMLRSEPLPAATAHLLQFHAPAIMRLNSLLSGARFTCDLPVLPAVC